MKNKMAPIEFEYTDDETEKEVEVEETEEVEEDNDEDVEVIEAILSDEEIDEMIEQLEELKETKGSIILEFDEETQIVFHHEENNSEGEF